MGLVRTSPLNRVEIKHNTAYVNRPIVQYVCAYSNDEFDLFNNIAPVQHARRNCYIRPPYRRNYLVKTVCLDTALSKTNLFIDLSSIFKPNN